ncbi:MAG: recombinase family protein [Candidatus Limnocylindrales bacterium]
MPAVAYLRKSRVTSDRSVSWEIQEAAVRELAAANGDADPLILSDWNKSGRRGADGRPGYRRLLEMIEAGDATAVYSYSLSRLSRSLSEFSRLVEIATDRAIPVRLHVERHHSIDTATGRLIVNILGAVAQMEAEIAQERARDAIEARRARGDRVGGIRYGSAAGEDVEAVIAAFRKVGTYRGAANLLTAQGAPSRRGRAWLAPTVRNILLRAAPELVPPRSVRGSAAAPRFRFARLLRCPYDDKLLTGLRARPGEGRERYACTHAYSVPGHGTRYVAESKVRPWIEVEVNRLQTPDRVTVLAGQDRKRAELDRRRGRILDMYEGGSIDRDAFRVRIATVDAALETLDVERRIVEVPKIDWDWPPETVNLVLRSMFEYVELGPDLQPVRAEWLVPEWRSDQ